MSLLKPKTMLAKVLTYLFISVMGAIALIALHSAILSRKSDYIVRYPVKPSEATIAKETATERSNKGVEWVAISTAVVSIIGGYLALEKRYSNSRFNKFETTVTEKLTLLFEGFNLIKDETFKKNIDVQLKDLEYDRSNLMPDTELKILFEGIAQRARDFTTDIITHHFDEECLAPALLKINARIAECKVQAAHLNISSNTILLINNARAVATAQLKADLTLLSKDHLVNHKYERIGKIMLKYEKRFFDEVITNYKSNG